MPLFLKEDPLKEADNDAWQALGNKIARIRPSESSRISRQRFIAFFGIEPTYCSMIWKLIVDSVLTQLKSKPKEEHLLWALMFLRRYDTHWILANNAGCDEKTFIKWSWFYVEAIANLDKKLVRNLIGQSVFLSLWLASSWHSYQLFSLFTTFFST
jgi:hypothetical protein